MFFLTQQTTLSLASHQQWTGLSLVGALLEPGDAKVARKRLRRGLTEEELQQWELLRLQRATDLAAAFRAGALGHTRWGSPGEFHEAQQLALQSELERLAGSSDQ